MEAKMKKSNWLLSTIILAIAIAMLSFAISCQKQDTEADIAAIEEIWDNYALGMITGDLDLWMSLYTDDIVKMLPDEPAVFGKEDLRTSMKPLFDNFTIEMAIYNKEVQVAGDWAFSRGTFTATLTPKAGGEPLYMDGKYLDILEKQADGSWKIARDCFNSNAPPKVE